MLLLVINNNSGDQDNTPDPGVPKQFIVNSGRISISLEKWRNLAQVEKVL